MKTLTQIALATIFFTTSMMAFAELATTNQAQLEASSTTNQAQLEASSTTVKHEGMTVTLTDKHFTSTEETKATASQTLTQSQKADSAPLPAI